MSRKPRLQRDSKRRFILELNLAAGLCHVGRMLRRGLRASTWWLRAVVAGGRAFSIRAEIGLDRPGCKSCVVNPEGILFSVHVSKASKHLRSKPEP